jgi:23S rRNA (adenine2503-C2)-methyltransferase
MYDRDTDHTNNMQRLMGLLFLVAVTKPTTSAWISAPKVISFRNEPVASDQDSSSGPTRAERISLRYLSTSSSLSGVDVRAPIRSSPLSLTLEELSASLGGKGRAQACWDCFRIGVDPLWYYGGDDLTETEPIQLPILEALSTNNSEDSSPSIWTRSQLQTLMAPRRKTNGLGRTSLRKLQSAFSKITNVEMDDFSNADSFTRIAKVIQVHQSQDGTTKLLLQLARDGLQVESVIIPWTDRDSSTLCISNQVGCGQGCTFCSTGRMGELRSLTADEILVQVYYAFKVCRLMPNKLPDIDAIVYMGMGEAARNVDNVVRSATNLVDPHLFQFAPRRVTISTVGPTPQSFAELGQAPVVLAWSVHASHDVVRQSLVPTSKYSMTELRDSLIETLLQRPKKLRQIMLELALIDNVNDRPEDAEHLVKFCQPFYKIRGCKLVVNLIPWNDISATSGPAAQYRKPSRESVLEFQRLLNDKGILCYIRTTRGDDESAACGQLATKARRKA